MKSTAIASLALLVSAGLASPPALALLTTSTVNGSLVGTFNIGGGQCSDSSGLLGIGTSANCGLTDGGTVLSPSTFNGIASAAPGELHLQLTAYASTFGYPGVTGRTIDYRTGGGGSAQFIDSFVITAPGVQVGTPGSLTGVFRIGGALGATVSGVVGVNNPVSQASASLSLQLGSSGAAPNASMGAGFGTGDEFTSGEIPGTVTLVTSFLFGVPIDISAKISGSLSAAADRVINNPAPGNSFDSEAQAGVGYGHSVYWGGIQSVTSANGAPIATFTALSPTGFNYAVAAVPEPAAQGLMLSGLLACVAAARRRRKGAGA